MVTVLLLKKWLNQLITNFLEPYKIHNTASTLFCLQPSHLTMTSDPKGTIIRCQTTPQSCINDLSFPILYPLELHLTTSELWFGQEFREYCHNCSLVVVLCSIL